MPSVTADDALGRQIGRGLGWSFLNNAIGRLGSFLSGIVIARILVPEEFGVYAVALVVLNVMLSMNELGVSLAVVRRPGSAAPIAPTVTTVALVSSAVLFVASWLAAPAVAVALGSPAATGVVRLLSVGVLIDGVTSVPVALMTRGFMQRRRLQIDLIAFVVSTPVTIVLALVGYGAWGLAWGAVVANLVSGALSVAWAPERYRPGFDRSVIGELLRFGLPLAGASMLLFLMLNVDYVTVGHVLGATALGLYTMAFNLCSWPSTLVSSAIRRVSMPAFARYAENGKGELGFRRAVFLVTVLTVPLVVLLACYANELITFLYGDKWAAAAVAVPALAVLGLGRILVELVYDYLVATGRTMSSLWLHAVWLVALVPALVLGAHRDGILGVAIGHAIVVAAVVIPALAVILKRAGVHLVALLRAVRIPVLGGGGIALSSWLVRESIAAPFWRLAIGGALGIFIYTALVGRRARHEVQLFLADDTPAVHAGQPD